MVMDWPDDTNTHTLDDQFMFGPAILVAPIQPGYRERKVYLPVGQWYDFTTHKLMAGGRWIKVQKPDEQVPMFVKSGTILPLAAPVEFVKADTCFELTVHIFGPARGSVTLYEDDGISLDYLNGSQNQVQIAWLNGQGTVKTTGNYSGPPRYIVKAFQRI